MTVTPLPLPSPVNNLLLTNWANQVSMACAYQTEISASRDDGAEDRLALIDKPARELISTFSGFDRSRATQMWMNLARFAEQEGIQPLYQDQSEVTADTTDRFDVPLQANVTDIACTTDYRRFFLGARVLIVQRSSEQIVKSEIATIASTPGSGTVTVFQLSSTFPSDSLLFPLMDVQVELKGSGRFRTDKVFNVKVKAKEVPGPSALNRTLTTTPAVSTHDGLPIFSTPFNWARAVKSSVVRAGKSAKQGKGVTVQTRESRPRFAHELAVRDERPELWSAIEFFDWAQGRRQAFWLVAPNITYTAVSVSTAQVAVEPIGLLDDHQDFLENVAIVLNDGTVYIRGISSITLVSGEWRIVFDTAIPSISLSDIAYTTVAHKVRFQSDSYKEAWVSPEWGEIKMSFVDLLAEGDVTITDIDPPDAEINPNILEIPDLYFWMDASGPAWFDVSSSVNPEVRARGYGVRHYPIFPNIPPTEHAYFSDDDEDFMFDVRQGAGDPSLTEPYLSRASATSTGGFNADSSSRPTLAFFDSEFENNGLVTNYHFGIRNSINRRTIGWELINSESEFWDNTDGLTVFVCARFGGDLFAEDDLLFLSMEGNFEWRNGIVRFFETKDTEDTNYNINYTNPNTSDLYILAVRWVPSSVADLYINGGSAEASATIPAPSINLTTERSHFMGMRPGGFGSGSGHPQDIDNSKERQHMSNAALVFDRGLSLAEINVVGDYLAKRYNGVWETAT